MIRCLVLVIAAILACGSSIRPTMRGPVRIHQCKVSMVGVTIDLPPDEQLIIKEAIDFWNAQGRKVFFYIGTVPWAPNESGASKAIVIIGYPLNTPILEAPSCELNRFNVVAHTEWKAAADGCMTWVSVSLQMTLHSLGHDRALHVVKHELGHVLGLDHSLVPFHLMSPISDCNTPPIQELAPEEVLTYRTLYGQE